VAGLILAVVFAASFATPGAASEMTGEAWLKLSSGERAMYVWGYIDAVNRASAAVGESPVPVTNLTIIEMTLTIQDGLKQRPELQQHPVGVAILIGLERRAGRLLTPKKP
jgi:hypothetical protein